MTCAKVISHNGGNALRPWFPCDPSYWKGRRERKRSPLPLFLCQTGDGGVAQASTEMRSLGLAAGSEHTEARPFARCAVRAGAVMY